MFKVDFICNMIMKYLLCNIYKFIRVMDIGEMFGIIWIYSM